MRYGYVRVSTDQQDYDTQRDAIIKEGVSEENIYGDVISGKTTSRENLDILLDKLKEGDELVVWKLDRLGRSTVYLLTTIEDFIEKGIKFKSITDGFDATTSMGKMALTMLASFSEYERNVISERTKAALAYKKSQGVKLGAPRRITDETRSMVLHLVARKTPYRQINRETGVSLGMIGRIAHANI